MCAMVDPARTRRAPSVVHASGGEGGRCAGIFPRDGVMNALRRVGPSDDGAHAKPAAAARARGDWVLVASLLRATHVNERSAQASPKSDSAKADITRSTLLRESFIRPL